VHQLTGKAANLDSSRWNFSYSKVTLSELEVWVVSARSNKDLSKIPLRVIESSDTEKIISALLNRFKQ
jgi:hypothetical protein